MQSTSISAASVRHDELVQLIAPLRDPSLQDFIRKAEFPDGKHQFFFDISGRNEIIEKARTTQVCVMKD
tara:strand:+ start:1570 stop:1776 length:207 start_codon:yes stop_codon:yes gene_type:complete